MTDIHPHARAILALTGEDRIHFLQGILTQDVAKLAQDRIQFAALLSPQGKILHDMFVIDAATVGGEADTFLLDTPALFKDTLLKRLTLYKLRAKVTITDVSDQWFVSFQSGTGLADPRHAHLPQRLYTREPAEETMSLTDYHHTRLTLGIPDSSHDFAPDEIVALDAGYDLLHAVSFTKGCYVGQEVTARMHYKNIARRGFYILSQNGIAQRLAMLKFEEVEKSAGRVTIEDVAYQAELPSWMEPKLAQFKTAAN